MSQPRTEMLDTPLIAIALFLSVTVLAALSLSRPLVVTHSGTDKCECAYKGEVLAVSAAGAFYLNAKPVSEDAIASRLAELLENRKERTVLLKADPEVRFAAVKTAVDRLRDAGVEDFTIKILHAQNVGGR